MTKVVKKISSLLKLSSLNFSDARTSSSNQKKNPQQKNKFNATGVVISVVDGIAKVKGLFLVGFGELVEFSNSEVGMVLSIESKFVQVVLFGNDRNILPGQTVSRKYNSLEIFVSFNHLGRIINSLGEFVDGKKNDLIKYKSETFESLSKENLSIDETKVYSE